MAQNCQPSASAECAHVRSARMELRTAESGARDGQTACHRLSAVTAGGYAKRMRGQTLGRTHRRAAARAVLARWLMGGCLQAGRGRWESASVCLDPAENAASAVCAAHAGNAGWGCPQTRRGSSMQWSTRAWQLFGTWSVNMRVVTCGWSCLARNHGWGSAGVAARIRRVWTRASVLTDYG